MRAQDIKAISISLGVVGGLSALGRVAALPVYFTAYILGSSFMAEIKASVAASKAAATLVGKVTLFPWVSAGIFTVASLVSTACFIYLSYKGISAALEFMRGRIQSGDITTVRRLSFLIPLMIYLPGPSLTKLAKGNKSMLYLLLKMGLGHGGPLYRYHLAQSENDLVKVLAQDPVDKGLAELMLHYTNFKADTIVGALVAAAFNKLGPSEGAQAALVRKLREAKYSAYSPVFQENIWVNITPFVDAGYGEMLFRAALEKKKVPSGGLLFDIYRIKPSDELLEIAVSHPKGEALTRDLIRRGHTIAFPFHKTALTAVAREFYESDKSSLDRRDSGGNTPLHAAAAQGFEGPFSYYRQQGLDIQAQNSRGETPFDLACKNGRGRLIRNLLETEGWREGPYNTFAWLRAASSGDLDLLKAFAGVGQDLFATAWEGKTALDLAAENGRNEAALWIAEQMRIACAGSFGWVNPKYPAAIKKAAALAREEDYQELSQQLEGVEAVPAPQPVYSLYESARGG